MTDGVERYSAEVADQLALDVQRMCPRVAYALHVLEERGELTSHKAGTRERGCRSGMGRRYYKHAARG